MILLLHLIVALSSLVASTTAYVMPSKTRLRITYGLVGLTLASGTYLVWSTHSPLLSSCVSGLVYVAVVMTGIVAAQRKLARQHVRIDQ